MCACIHVCLHIHGGAYICVSACTIIYPKLSEPPGPCSYCLCHFQSQKLLAPAREKGKGIVMAEVSLGDLTGGAYFTCLGSHCMELGNSSAGPSVGRQELSRLFLLRRPLCVVSDIWWAALRA